MSKFDELSDKAKGKINKLKGAAQEKRGEMRSDNNSKDRTPENHDDSSDRDGGII